MAKKNSIEVSVLDGVLEAPNVLADHTRFKQVLLNLISNAIKYNRENGTILISFEETAGNMLRIAVADTGAGIAIDKQSELFKPFSRLGAENTEIEGTGIGLVVCKELVTLMNGTVGLESTIGKGSKFWIELPLSESLSHPPMTTVETALLSAQSTLPVIDGTLLYIEDNPENLKLMELIVERIGGLSIISTHTGEFGIELARSEKPDIIILDINLPGMNGIEVLKKLRGHSETKNIPVLGLSASATAKDIEKGTQAGFHQYLTKPINVPKIVEAIQKYIVRPDE